jgi:hypothetical protein
MFVWLNWAPDPLHCDAVKCTYDIRIVLDQQSNVRYPTLLV